MFSKNDGIVFSFANRKEFKYQSFDMCLALWPAHNMGTSEYFHLQQVASSLQRRFCHN